MSAACADVSAVAASSGHIRAPAKARVFMPILPCWPERDRPALFVVVVTRLRGRRCSPSDRSTVVPPAIGGQYPIAHVCADGSAAIAPGRALVGGRPTPLNGYKRSALYPR